MPVSKVATQYSPALRACELIQTCPVRRQSDGKAAACRAKLLAVPQVTHPHRRGDTQPAEVDSYLARFIRGVEQGEVAAGTTDRARGPHAHPVLDEVGLVVRAGLIDGEHFGVG